MCAEHWVIYTFGVKAGMMLIVTRGDEIISYSQVVGCMEFDKAQLWGLGTNKKYQLKGYGTLTYEITKQLCKVFEKKKLEINVEPENPSNKIYCKDKPEILAFGKFYPTESPRSMLSVDLYHYTSENCGKFYHINAFDYEKMKEIVCSNSKNYLIDWYVKNNTPFLRIMAIPPSNI